MQTDRSLPLASAAEQAANRRRWTALYVLCTGMLMIVLDSTVVNVALPAIQDDLGFTSSGLAWVVNAYMIAFGGFLLLAGRFGDLLGRRNVFLAGLVTFTVASALCGLAQSSEMLVAARFVQGIGGALTSAVILGIIVTMFPEQREQAKAIGVYAFVASAGGAIGLLIGGVLTEAINWHWIFFVNIPIGVAAVALTMRLVESDSGTGFDRRTDILGAALITCSLMLGVYTIVKPAAESGWTAKPTLYLGALTLGLLVAFVARQALARNPLVPLRIFRSRSVSGANLIQVFSVGGMFGTFFLGSLYLERVLHYGPLEIGLAFLPVTIIMGTLSVRYSEKLLMRFGLRGTLLPGLALILIALILFAQAPVNGTYLAHVFPVMVLLGFGAGLCFPALMGMAMTGVAAHEAGLASGLVSTSAQVGGALGLAVLATLSASRSSAQTTAGMEVDAALVSGYHLAFWIAAALVATAIACAVVALRRPAEQAETDKTTGELAEMCA